MLQHPPLNLMILRSRRSIRKFHLKKFIMKLLNSRSSLFPNMYLLVICILLLHFICDLSYAAEPVYVCMCLLFLMGSGWGIRFDLVIYWFIHKMLFFSEVQLLPGLSLLWTCINLVSVTSWDKLCSINEKMICPRCLQLYSK